MSREADIAWAAGLFEGEGSITRTWGAHLHISLASTDKDVIDRFREIAGVGGIGGWQGEPPRKYTHQWYADGEAADQWLRTMLPYLGLRRTARAKELLAARARYIADATAPRQCIICGATFTQKFGPGWRRKYCSKPCSDAAQYQRKKLRRRRLTV